MERVEGLAGVEDGYMNPQQSDENEFAPTQFLLTDIYALLFQLGCFGALIIWLLKDESATDKAYVQLFASVIISALWYGNVQALNRTGIRSRGSRAFWLIFIPLCWSIPVVGWEVFPRMADQLLP